MSPTRLNFRNIVSPQTRLLRKNLGGPTLKEERWLWQKGYVRVAGLDEVGRGAWAGPLVAAAVVFLPGAKRIPGVRDSKTLTPRARTYLSGCIIERAHAWGVGVVGAATIDRVGVVEANQRAMRQALQRLHCRPDATLTDAFPLVTEGLCYAVPDGDGRVYTIAAASIIAKVWRDRLMVRLHRRYPAYHFDRHKGYGTRVHEAAIRMCGMSALHRCSFVPTRCLPR